MDRCTNAFVIVGAVSLPLLMSPGCASDARCVEVSEGTSAAKHPRTLQNTDDSGIAIQGYDPVGYFTESKPVRGDHRFRSTYRGATYLFASESNKATFDADPAKYEPQFGGYCAYAASINKVSPIDPQFWEVVNGRLVLQHNQKAWDLWHKDPAGSLVKADQNWPEIARTRCN